jgi:hypothetical protein
LAVNSVTLDLLKGCGLSKTFLAGEVVEVSITKTFNMNHLFFLYSNNFTFPYRDKSSEFLSGNGGFPPGRGGLI